jgi:hypothetical protein
LFWFGWNGWKVGLEWMLNPDVEGILVLLNPDVEEFWIFNQGACFQGLDMAPFFY